MMANLLPPRECACALRPPASLLCAVRSLPIRKNGGHSPNHPHAKPLRPLSALFRCKSNGIALSPCPFRPHMASPGRSAASGASEHRPSEALARPKNLQCLITMQICPKSGTASPSFRFAFRSVLNVVAITNRVASFGLQHGPTGPLGRDKDVSFQSLTRSDLMNGKQLRRCRLLTGLSTSNFAKELGLTAGNRSVREMERGTRNITGPVERVALAMVGLWPFDIPRPDPEGEQLPLPILDDEWIDGALATLHDGKGAYSHGDD